MITVAVPGGTSPGLGRAVVTALKQYADITPVILSRQASRIPQWLEEAGVEVRKVDYASEESLYNALQGVHTILCVLLAADGTWAATQKKLLQAGLRAGISRFAPAEFGVGPLGDHQVAMFKPALEIAEACREAKKSHPDFEYACFHVGLFMNYLGYGARDEKAATHEMRDEWVFIFDVKGMKADIPLGKDGSVPRMTMTEIGDVGRFAAAACLLPKGAWREDFSMAGDTLALDEIVRVIEDVRGRKMEVTHRPYEQIEKEEKENEIVYPNGMWLQIELLVAQNIVGGSIVEPIVNRLCPKVKPLSVEAYMRKFWSVE